jgi:hypothetical protein
LSRLEPRPGKITCRCPQNLAHQATINGFQVPRPWKEDLKEELGDSLIAADEVRFASPECLSGPAASPATERVTQAECFAGELFALGRAFRPCSTSRRVE